MKIYGFDMDGVLAEGPPQHLFSKKWGHMNGEERKNRERLMVAHYAMAKLIINPEAEKFHVISARKNREDVNRVTLQWLQMHFPGRVLGAHLLTASRTLKNVIEFKSSTIHALGITDFTEDNEGIVRGLRRACPKVHVWLYKGGQILADPKKVLENI